MILRAACLALICLAAPLAAQQAPPETAPTAEEAMTWPRLEAIVRAIDPETVTRGPMLDFTLDGIPVLIVADPAADRMRAMVPIASAEGLDAVDLLRMMQANFDTALDARYAVAQGRVWGVFIHPLSPLEKDQLLSALIQTVNVARTYGQSYSGGAQIFGGGDSDRIYRDLLKQLQKKGDAL